MKILVDYNSMTGMISINGMEYYTMMNLAVQEHKESVSAVNTDTEVVKLSNNGMTADDLVKLRESGVI